MHGNRVALITGANQGIGLQIAKDLAVARLTVLVGSRDLKRGEDAAKTIKGEAYAIQLDVTDQASVAAAAARIRKELGRLDVLVNNAGISNTGWRKGMSVEDYTRTTLASTASLDEVRAVWETNVFGPLAVFQAMLPLLRAAPQASIFNLSIAGGSLTLNAHPANTWRQTITPV
jgi:NAD(P)-dependent dehydrogenase (short-subunit alcohol dehydrogenase family)